MPTILITGGHSGIGLECVNRLAQQPGLHLVLAGRSPAAMDAVAARLRREQGATVSTLALDTASLASVRAAASELRARRARGELAPLQALLCNAGGRGFGPLQYSPDGYEQTFAGNYLGHFLLANLLLDDMAEHGRIVFTASGTHDPDSRDGKAVGPAVAPEARRLAHTGQAGSTPLATGVLYATSKLCLILFAYELHRRLRQAGSQVAALAFDPGSVVGTGFLRGAPAALRWVASSAFGQWLAKRMGITVGALDVSGDALARLATDPAYASGSGKYFQVNAGAFGEARSSTASYDLRLASALWADSAALVGLEPETAP